VDADKGKAAVGCCMPRSTAAGSGDSTSGSELGNVSMERAGSLRAGPLASFPAVE
jgi:hypothetical protein